MLLFSIRSQRPVLFQTQVNMLSEREHAAALSYCLGHGALDYPTHLFIVWEDELVIIMSGYKKDK